MLLILLIQEKRFYKILNNIYLIGTLKPFNFNYIYHR